MCIFGHTGTKALPYNDTQKSGGVCAAIGKRKITRAKKALGWNQSSCWLPGLTRVGPGRVPTRFLYALASSLIIRPPIIFYMNLVGGENADMCDSRGMLNAQRVLKTLKIYSHPFWLFVFLLHTHIDSCSRDRASCCGTRRLIFLDSRVEGFSKNTSQREMKNLPTVSRFAF